MILHLLIIFQLTSMLNGSEQDRKSNLVFEPSSSELELNNTEVSPIIMMPNVTFPESPEFSFLGDNQSQ